MKSRGTGSSLRSLRTMTMVSDGDPPPGSRTLREARISGRCSRPCRLLPPRGSQDWSSAAVEGACSFPAPPFHPPPGRHRFRLHHANGYRERPASRCDPTCNRFGVAYSAREHRANTAFDLGSRRRWPRAAARPSIAKRWSRGAGMNGSSCVGGTLLGM